MNQTNQLSSYLCYRDLEKDNIDIEALASALSELRGVKKPITEAEKKKELVKFIDEADVQDYIWLCNMLERYLAMSQLASDLRKLLKPTQFGWEWVKGDWKTEGLNILLKSSHCHFRSEESCKLDGLRHAADDVITPDARLCVTAYFSNGDEFGTVQEVKSAGVQTVSRKTKRLGSEETKRKKIKYDCRYSEDLGDDVRMQIFLQENDYSVDIRKWATVEGQKTATRKGIRMSLGCFVRLVWLQDTVQDRLDKIKSGEKVDEKILVGGPVFIQMSSPFLTVHVREFYTNGENKIKPGRRGIVMKLRQWQKMLTLARELDDVIPQFSEMKPCYYDTDHANQEGMMSCSTCSYFDEECTFE